MIHITEVTTKAQLRQFVNFPIDLYRDVPQYIPGTYSDDLAEKPRLQLLRGPLLAGQPG